MELGDANALARILLDQHGLADWKFRFDRARTRFGLCSHRHKTISLSRHLTALNERAHVLDTILHEIAHGKAGPREGHGRRWRAVAATLGCRPKACYDDKAVLTPPKAWVGTCPNCHRTIHRNRRPGRPRGRHGHERKIACVHCCREFARGRFDERFVFTWHRNHVMTANSFAPPPIAIQQGASGNL